MSPTPVGAEPRAHAPAPLLRAAEPPPSLTPAPQVSLEAQLLRFRLVAPDQMSEAMRIEAESGTLVSETVVERGWVSAEDLQKVIDSLEPDVAPAAEAAPVPPTAPPPAPVASIPEPVAQPAPPPAPEAAPPPAPEAAPPPAPEPMLLPAPPPAPEAQLPPPALVEPESVPAAQPPPVAPLPPAPVAPPAPPAAGDGVVRVIVRLRSGELLEAGVFDDAAEARGRAKELVEEVQAEDAWPFIAGRSVSAEKIDTIYLEKH